MDGFPKCAVCSSVFKYQCLQPHLLPCLNAVCSQCVLNNQTINCSVCGRCHQVTKQPGPGDEFEDVTGGTEKQSQEENLLYPVNNVVLREVFRLTAQHSPHEILCTNRDDGHQAVCWCQECGELLCEHCQTAHGEVKVTRGHKVTDLTTIDPSSLVSMCSLHDLPEDLYDKNCDIMMCDKCFIQDHVRHEKLSKEELAVSRKHDLDLLTTSIKDKMEGVYCASADVEELSKSLGGTSVRVREYVVHTFTELRNLLNQREKEALIEFDQTMSTMNDHNNSRKSTLTGLEADCMTTTGFMARSMDLLSPVELHDVKTYVEEAIKSCETAEVPQVHKLESNLCFSTEGLQLLKSSVRSFGCFLIPRTVSWQPDEFRSPLTEKIRMLNSTKDKLDNQLKEVSQHVAVLESEITNYQSRMRSMEDSFQNVVKEFGTGRLSPGSSVHLIKTGNREEPLVVQCPQLSLDADRMNMAHKYLDENEVMMHGHKLQPPNSRRFKNFLGATSTTALPSSGLVYWEVMADMEKNYTTEKGHTGNVHSISVCHEDIIDKSAFTFEHPLSAGLCIFSTSDMDLFKVAIYNNGKGKFSTLHVNNRNHDGLHTGVLYDADQKTVTFIDITQGVRLANGQIPKTKTGTFWPVFDMWQGTTKMEVVSGKKIVMDEEKMELIRAQVSI